MQRILKLCDVTQAELSIVFVTSQKIRALNKKYLNRTYATDVLAFNLTPDYETERTPSPLIGDVFISTDAARQSVKIYHTDIAHEIVLYVVHGILHLLGYDDHSESDTREMRSAEARLMDRLKRSIPGVIDAES